MSCDLPLKIRKGDDGSQAMVGNFACYCLFSTKDPHRVYTGYTNNFARRLKEHNTSSKGAKHTHEGRPYVPLIIVSGFKTRKEALRFEKNMKKRRCSKRTYGVLGRMSTLLVNLRRKDWKGKQLRVLCKFRMERLQQMCKPKDKEIKSEFVFSPFTQ